MLQLYFQHNNILFQQKDIIYHQKLHQYLICNNIMCIILSINTNLHISTYANEHISGTLLMPVISTNLFISKLIYLLSDIICLVLKIQYLWDFYKLIYALYVACSVCVIHFNTDNSMEYKCTKIN